MAANPALAGFTLTGVLKDTATLLISTDIAVLMFALVAAWFVVRELPRIAGRGTMPPDKQPILAPVTFFFGFLGLLSVAYVTHQQPIIFPRYGLILFSLGIPILAWCFLTLKQRQPRWARTLLISIIVICVVDWSIQFAGAIGSVNATSAQRAVADYLRDHFDPNSNARIFSDEGTVTVMSGIPEHEFLTSSEAPRDRESFLRYLKEKNVEYLVFVSKEDSTPAKLFPELKNATANEAFAPVMHSRSRFLRMEIWLYRTHRSTR